MVGTPFGRAALRRGSRAATRRGRLVIADDRPLVRALDAAFVSQKRAEATGPVSRYWQARPISWWKCSRPATLTRSCTRRRWDGFRQARAWSSSPTQRAGASLSRQQIQQLLAQPRGTSPVALRDRALLERLEELSEALETPICHGLESPCLQCERLAARITPHRGTTPWPEAAPPAAAAPRSALRAAGAWRTGWPPSAWSSAGRCRRPRARRTRRAGPVAGSAACCR